MQCIFPCRSGAQYYLLSKHRNSQTRRQLPQMPLFLGLPTPQHDHVRRDHRPYSSTHQTRQHFYYPSLGQIAPSHLSAPAQSPMLSRPASPRQTMSDSQVARKAQRKHRAEPLGATSARQDRRTHRQLQTVPPDLLKAVFGIPALLPQCHLR
jgi:hypothetical protein